jgi:hypothetical protein
MGRNLLRMTLLGCKRRALRSFFRSNVREIDKTSEGFTILANARRATEGKAVTLSYRRRRWIFPFPAKGCACVGLGMPLPWDVPAVQVPTFWRLLLADLVSRLEAICQR